MPLGIQLKNEAKLSDMCHILTDLSQYIPAQKRTKCIEIEGESYTHDMSEVVQILFFGDQLTVARARGASVLRYLHPTTLDRLKGFVPTVVDWHARQCLMKVHK